MQDKDYSAWPAQTLHNETIGVTSKGALGHVPLNFQLFNLSDHFRAQKPLIFDFIVAVQ